MIKKAAKHAFAKFRFNLSAKNNPLFIGYYKRFYSPEKGSLNEFLNIYSKSKRDQFTVVQVGANDGITHDPIHKFIKRDQWNGVLLEPQSFTHDNFLKKIYARNEGINTLNAAIGKTDGETTLHKIGFCNMPWATGLASFSKENVERAFSNGLVKKNCTKYKIDIPENGERITSERVQIISPATLMKQYKISNIDLLQIDVEGYDAEVVRIFNIKNTQPRAIIFENSHLSEEDITSCTQLLKENNYAVKKYGANTLAMKAPLGEWERYF